MCTPDLAKWLSLGACTMLIAAGCATQRSADVPQTAYGGGKLNLGTTLTSAELANYFSYPADGRGLPSGSGSYAQGEKVYQTKCMACHGDKLQGTPLGDRLIGGRGTLVRVEMQYSPPAGSVSATVAKLFRAAPGQQIEQDLRALKQVLETGEIARSDASIHRGMHPAQPSARAAIA